MRRLRQGDAIADALVNLRRAPIFRSQALNHRQRQDKGRGRKNG
jgi:hypothetical protein